MGFNKVFTLLKPRLQEQELFVCDTYWCSLSNESCSFTLTLLTGMQDTSRQDVVLKHWLLLELWGFKHKQ